MRKNPQRWLFENVRIRYSRLNSEKYLRPIIGETTSQTGVARWASWKTGIGFELFAHRGPAIHLRCCVDSRISSAGFGIHGADYILLSFTVGQVVSTVLVQPGDMVFTGM